MSDLMDRGPSAGAGSPMESIIGSRFQRTGNAAYCARKLCLSGFNGFIHLID
ncbi:hypothetical protein OP10G_3871 [Fimbriimonas ginsengisoli Gsoil 348]|uniref:Uncharacterized protein n=1 Tax=Fimbriimonas ginsengisoli Gsoil 348 TaxID=661478 RepID=A0A068NYQ6_FIMGI|nr:hypothetical protein OP10G_3871 [Fimbriimonas ginsengisoli Gsoil 348]